MTFVRFYFNKSNISTNCIKSDNYIFIFLGRIELYPTQENKDIVIALNAIGADVGFVEIKSDKGHDSFLLDVPDFLKTLKNFLDKSYSER